MPSPSEGWDDVYRAGNAPPWDIGRPQPVFTSLAREGRIAGSVLDAGCGTGEHALLAAAYGATALGVDLSVTAIARAREKAQTRGLSAQFQVGDLLEMPLPPAGFDTVLDSGVFHSFDDADRGRFVGALAHAVRPGGVLHLLCFSDRQPGDWGPRRVRREELMDAFADGWAVDRLEPAVFEINPLPEADLVQAWSASIRRL